MIGFMGAGKTSTGRLVARSLGREFVDTDSLVERAARAEIAEIFRREGEEGFRRREIGAIDFAISTPDRVGRIRDLLVARGPIYETAGDVGIDTDRLTAEQAATEVLDWYQRRVGELALR